MFGSALGADDLPDGLVVADHDQVITVFNRAAERITGVPAGKALGQDVFAMLPFEDLNGRDWAGCTNPFGGLRTRTGEPERAMLLPGGREVLLTARYVRDKPLGPMTALVLGLRPAHARAREERSQGELVSTVAHELRSPLTTVKGFTATLLAKWDRFTDDQRKLMLETVDADADRITRLITELLDIARIDSRRLEIRRELVDLPAMIDRHVTSFVARGQPEDRFVVEIRTPLPDLWADADKVEQVLANLLENAVRHGAGSVTIVVEAARLGPAELDQRMDATAVTVMDEGDGIPADQYVRVFTKWWRSGKRGGTGLGLYIVRGLVEAHGGSIALGSAPGGGALFRFVLPAGTPGFAA